MQTLGGESKINPLESPTNIIPDEELSDVEHSTDRQDDLRNQPPFNLKLPNQQLTAE